MSHLANDALYDRMVALLPHLTPMTAQELSGYIEENDLASAHYLLEILEAKYASDLVDAN